MRTPVMPGPPPGLVEALAPLGMPDVRYDWRGRYRDLVSRMCAVCLASSWARRADRERSSKVRSGSP